MPADSAWRQACEGIDHCCRFMESALLPAQRLGSPDLQVLHLSHRPGVMCELFVHEVYSIAPYSQWTMDVMLLSPCMHMNALCHHDAVSADHADPQAMLAIGLSDNSVEVHSVPGHATSHQDGATVCLAQQKLHCIVQDIALNRQPGTHLVVHSLHCGAFAVRLQQQLAAKTEYSDKEQALARQLYP